MAGLLDSIAEAFSGNTESSRRTLGLLAAAGPTTDPNQAGFGARMLRAANYVDDWKKQQMEMERAKQMQEFQAFQMQAMKDQAAQQAADRARQEEIRTGMGQFFKAPQAAIPAYNPIEGLPPEFMTGAVPTKAQDAKPASFDAGGAAQFLASKGEYGQALPLLASLEPKETVYKPGDVVFKGGKQVLSIPKEPTTPAELQGYQYAKQQGYGGTFLDYQKEIKRAGATSLSVNTDNLGLKPKDRFDMEDKMRADYSKATANDSEIINTAQDLRNILKQGGALKDQAAIYKFAKSLDPQGAVREADYAAIVQTAGGLDYVTALVNKALTGEQLSAKQRIEMANLMDSMASVAKTRIAKNQQRFGANAKMYNLNPENIFQQQAEGDGWAIVSGGK